MSGLQRRVYASDSCQGWKVTGMKAAWKYHFFLSSCEKLEKEKEQKEERMWSTSGLFIKHVWRKSKFVKILFLFSATFVLTTKSTSACVCQFKKWRRAGCWHAGSFSALTQPSSSLCSFRWRTLTRVWNINLLIVHVQHWGNIKACWPLNISDGGILILFNWFTDD